MSSDALGFLTREELLGGLPARRASTLLFAIESRTAHLVARSRQAMARHLTERTAAEQERAFLEAFAEGREPPVQPTIQDLERCAPQWAALVAPDAAVRAAVARMIGEKYVVPQRRTTALQRALGLNDESVRLAFQRLHGRSLETIFAAGVPRREQARWAQSRLSHRLETLPPFWAAYALTLTGTIGPSILVLPIAFAEVGPLAGVVLLTALGAVNLLTIAATAETVARNGNARYGRAYWGRLVSDYFGGRTASILASIDLVLDTAWLCAFVIGLSSILASVTTAPAWLWPAPLFLASFAFLRRPTLNATVASSLILGLVNLLLIAAILMLALPHVREANLRHARVPFVDGEPFTPSVLSLVFGVVLVVYGGHYSVRNSARVVLPRDPSARTLMTGSTAAMATVIVLYCLWIVGMNGAVAPASLAAESGTVLSPLSDAVGSLVFVFGTLYAALTMGLYVVYIVLGLSFQVQEWLPIPMRPTDTATPRAPRWRGRALRAVVATERRQFWLGVAPSILAFLATQGLILSGRESFTDAVSFLGVISLATLGGILPMLMGFASRRMGDYPLAVAWRLVGHPIVVATVCSLFLAGVLLHGLVIWDVPYQRGAALLAAIGTVALAGSIIRRGSFRPRAVVELRLEPSEAPVVNVTARGDPVQADVRWPAGIGAAGLGTTAVLDIPPVPVAELKIWTHRLGPDGLSLPLAARVILSGGGEPRILELDAASGQAVVPVSGAAQRLEVTLVDARRDPGAR